MMIGSLGDPDGSFAASPKAILRAIDYIRARDFTKIDDGRYQIEGDDMYATVTRYMSRPASECRPETHRKYVDLLYLVSGEEYLGWCPMNPDLKVTSPYDEAADVEFYEKLVPESSFVLSEGSVVVLFPKDVHQPYIMIGDTPSPITKVIVKISVGLLK